jgi:acyl carrier protein
MTANLTGHDVKSSSPQTPDVGDVADIIARLKRIIVEELDLRITAAEVTEDVPLLEGGLALDSIVLYELITLIEKRFGFEFADDNLHPEQFANLTVLAQHIHAVTAQRARAVAS